MHDFHTDTHRWQTFHLTIVHPCLYAMRPATSASQRGAMGVDTARVVRSELLETSLQELICVYCLDLVDPGDALQVRVVEH